MSNPGLEAVLARLGGENPNEALAVYVSGVRSGRSLSRLEARDVMGILASGRFAERQAGEFLAAMADKGVTAEELVGFAEAARERSRKIALPGLPPDALLADTCGTGCDGVGTINVSTTVMFILAAAGVRVAKHGNKAITSRSGSADVLERLGINLTPGGEVVARCLREVGVGFLYAPGFHESFRHVQGVRRALMGAGVKTVFNYLGPLTNPCGARRQLVGVFRPEIARLMAEALRGLGSERALCACGRVASHPDRYLDEFSTLGETVAVEMRDGRLADLRCTPEEFGMRRASLDEVRGGDADENAKVLLDTLGGKERGPKRDIVLLNAGAGIYICKDGVASIQEGIEIARSHLESGAALAKLEALKTVSNSL